MGNILFFIILIIILSKILINGVGFFDISVWFYLLYSGIYLLFIWFLNNKRNTLFSPNYLTYIKYCFIFLLVIIFVYLLNDLIFDQYKNVLQFLGMIGLSIMTYCSIDNEKKLITIINAIIIGIICSAVIGIAQFFQIDLPFDTVMDGQRTAGLSNTVIVFSYELILGITLLFSRLILFKNKRIIKISMMIGLIVLIVVLIINQTRSAIIATVVDLLLILLFYGKNNNIKPTTLLIPFASLVALILIGTYTVETLEIYTRFQSNESSEVRLPMIITGINYAFNNPLGTGVYNLSAYPVELNYDADIADAILNNTTHNHLINVLIYYGFLGLIIAVKIYQIIFKSFFTFRKDINKNRNKYAYFYTFFICILGYSINSMTHNAGLFNSDPIIWIIIAIFFVMNKIEFATL